MAKRLRDLGLVQIERLSDGSYRWRVPVLAERRKQDPIPIPIGYDRLIRGLIIQRSLVQLRALCVSPSASLAAVYRASIAVRNSAVF